MKMVFRYIYDYVSIYLHVNLLSFMLTPLYFPFSYSMAKLARGSKDVGDSIILSTGYLGIVSLNILIMACIGTWSFCDISYWSSQICWLMVIFDSFCIWPCDMVHIDYWAMQCVMLDVVACGWKCVMNGIYVKWMNRG